MDITELEKRISQIFASAIEARNANDACLQELSQLRQWIREREVARLKASLK